MIISIDVVHVAVVVRHAHIADASPHNVVVIVTVTAATVVVMMPAAGSSISPTSNIVR